ncbi:ATP-binding protein [Evansella sp. LMS18]|nr:ATP-binding protein [Evansella sp. LMS18]
MMSFILDGLEKGELILLLETEYCYKKIMHTLQEAGADKAILNSIIFYENTKYYKKDNKINAEHASNNFKRLLGPVIEEGKAARIWGRLDWAEQDTPLTQLRIYECECDKVLEKEKYLTVCCYSGSATPANIYMDLLKTHPYFMTDEMRCYPSPLYVQYHASNLSGEEFRTLESIDRENKSLREKNRKLIVENERIALKKELVERNEKFYRDVFNNVPVGIFVTEGETIKFVNDKGVRILGLQQSMIAGRNLFDILPVSKPDVLSSRLPGTDSGSASNILYTEFSLPDGMRKYVELTSLPQTFEESNETLYVMVDLTDQKMAENMIVRSEKLNIAGELAAGIAHEIRNPLTSLKGFIKLLESSPGKKEYFTILNNELDRIEQISGELLILAKPHSERKKELDITGLLEDIKVLLSTQAIIKGISINSEYAEGSLAFFGDETKIKQVFINIMKNAIEAMDTGEIRIGAKREGRDINITISDEGPGMPEHVLSRIGEPFFTTKEKGSGLGLTICYRIIESSGGTISINSQNGKGTTFFITLPGQNKNAHAVLN